MKFIKNFRISIGKKIYKRKILQLKRNITATGLQQIKSACIIFETSKTNNLKHVKELRKILPEDAEIKIIGYIEGKKKDFSFISDKTYNYISDEDFDFFMQPKNEYINQFINNQFDALFMLSFNYHFALDLISGLSKARFKIGKSGVYEKNLDFFIETDSKDCNYLISQFAHYLA